MDRLTEEKMHPWLKGVTATRSGRVFFNGTPVVTQKEHGSLLGCIKGHSYSIAELVLETFITPPSNEGRVLIITEELEKPEEPFLDDLFWVPRPAHPLNAAALEVLQLFIVEEENAGHPLDLSDVFGLIDDISEDELRDAVRWLESFGSIVNLGTPRHQRMFTRPEASRRLREQVRQIGG